MTMQIYFMNITPLFLKEKQEKMLAFVDRERALHTLSLKQEKSKAQSLGAGLLLSYVLWKRKCGETAREARAEASMVTVSEVTADTLLQCFSALPETSLKEHLAGIQVERTSTGKPYLKSSASDRGEQVFFNLSHSGDYVACVLSDKEVGMDLQEEKAKVPDLNRRLLNEREMPPESAQDFYRLWAVKEAYVKCTGTGLLKDLRELYVDFEKNRVRDVVTGEERVFLLPKCPKGYAAAVCFSS